jgi:hypothetical protein
MSKQTWFRMLSVTAVLVLALAGVSAVFAAPATQAGATPDDTTRLAGRITSLSDPDFVVQTLRGESVTVHTTGATEWRNLNGFGDLRVGMLVGAGGVLEGNGTLNAHVVVRLRPRLLRGTVTATGDHSLTVQTLRGESVTVTWSDTTTCVIRGNGDGADSSACSRIQTGDHVAAAGEFDGTTLNAHHIWAFVPGVQQPPSKTPMPSDKP